MPVTPDTSTPGLLSSPSLNAGGNNGGIESSVNRSNTSGPNVSSLAATAGLGIGGANIPNMIGDNFGGGQATAVLPNRVTFNLPARGFVLQTGPLPSDSAIGFSVDLDNFEPFPFDIVTNGPGVDTNGDGTLEQFPIAEPVSPSQAPLSPGPNFAFDGGTATHPSGLFETGEIWDIAYSYSEPVAVVLPAPGGGGIVVGRMKIAENSSPLPRNRIFFNYSLFDNVPLLAGGVTVNRFSPGFETTFLDGNYSFEMRVPFAATVDSNLFADGPTATGNIELGDLFMSLKSLLWQTDSTIVSAGVSFTVPTADDVHVSLVDGTRLVSIENQTVHLMPFIGGYQALSAQSFVHGFIQVDLDLNGNPVSANLDGRGLTSVGTIQDSTFLHLDGGWGYRIQPNSNGSSRLTQIIPTIELHYTESLQASDLIQAGNFRIGEFKERIQVLNAVAGVSLEFDRRTYLSVGYAVPVGNSTDQLFDGELRAFWNRLY